jgi:uncharacterized membrane protein
MQLIKRIRRKFMEGLLVFLPAFLTFFIIYSVIKAVYNFMDFGVLLLPENLRSNLLLSGAIVIITIILLILIVAAIGKYTQTFFGGIIYRNFNSFIASIPIIKMLYISLQKLLSTVFGSTSKTFSRPVLVPFPHPGNKSIGFLTGEAKIIQSDGRALQMYKVFIPTAPNPTTGFLIHYPKDHVAFPDITSEDALRLVLSAGILTK